MSFGIIVLNQNIKTMQNYVTWKLTWTLADVYKDIADDVKKIYDTSNYEVDRPLPKKINKKIIDLIKDELGGELITEFVVLRPKTYFYLIDDDKNVIKAKGAKNV